MNFTMPIQVAFGGYLNDFHKQIIPDTPSVEEYASRAFSKSAVWAPGRMVDQIEEMIAAWRKNDTSRQARATPYLPIIIAAISKDYTPAQGDWTRHAADPIDVMIPNDPKNRVFKMRVAFSEVRIQIAIAAPDGPSARSIAMQLALFSQATERRRIYAEYALAGVDQPWPFVWKEPDLMSISLPQDVKNLTVLTADFVGVASVPMLTYPRVAAGDSDGQGGNDYADPNGYLVVKQADVFALAGNSKGPIENITQVGDLQS